MKKVLIVVTSHDQLGSTGKKTGYYLPELTHPYFQLVDAGFEVDIASPKGGKAPMDETSQNLQDPLNKRFMENPKLVEKIETTYKASDIDPIDYMAIIYSGGSGTMWDFPENKNLIQISSTIYENGGVVGAVCHGPAALVNIKLSDGSYLIDGKSIAGFSNDEEKASGLSEVVPFLLESKLIERGGKYSKSPLWKEKVVVDGRLVTGQNPASALGVGKKVAEILKTNLETC